MKKWTRRKFLETSLKGSMAVGGGALAGPTTLAGVDKRQKTKPLTLGLQSHQRQVLRAAMDEIIPAGDGMPAASEVGGVEYLNHLAQQAAEIKQQLEKSLASLESLSRKRFGKDFLSLSRPERAQALAELEKHAEPGIFGNLRDDIYEAYYTQPQVWKMMGYEFYPTNQSGPRMKPFDEAVLAEVRKKPKFYREV